MSPKVLFIHARNQIRTVWLMTGRRFSSPFEIQTRNPSVTLSIIALLAGYALFAVYDYLYYPTDLINGFIHESVSRTAYVATYFFAYLAGAAFAYGALFALAIPLKYAKRFWHGFIALNWWSAIVTFAIFPAMLLLLLMSDDDPFLSPFMALLVFVFIVIIWKTVLLVRHSLRVGTGKAVLLSVLSAAVQFGVMALLTHWSGIQVI